MHIACQSCNKHRATVHLTDVTPTGDTVERHLCEECASQEGVALKQTETTTAVLHEFLRQAQREQLRCPECGLTVSDFQKKGLLGCPNDYKAFEPVLGPLIERAHEGATHHAGKAPRSAGSEARRLTDLRRLRRDLQESLDREEYERASQLRDAIREMEAS